MTGGRAKSQANRQRRALHALGVARQREPGPEPGTLAGVDALLLALLDAVEHAANVARLGRGGADPRSPEADGRWRRRLIAVNAVAAALSEDAKTGTTTATDRLYRRITTEPQEEA